MPAATLNSLPSALTHYMTSLTPDQKRLYTAVAVTAALSSTITVIGVSLYRHAVTAAAGREPQGSGRTESAAIYDSEASARQYMEFHFTPSRDSFTHRLRSINEAFDFPSRLAKKFKDHLPAAVAGSGCLRRGLDIGCATGASVLEMSRFFDGGVVGMDFSEVFIHLAKEAAASAATGEAMAYTAPVQGIITEPRTLKLPRGVYPSRCEFYAGDAMDMFDEDHGGQPPTQVSQTYPDVCYWRAKKDEVFDGVLCLNLIDRVPHPARLLDSLARLVRPGGVLVFADPYSWWEGATAKAEWLGGSEANGVLSEVVVKEHLSKDFDLLAESEEAFLIRDHIRHYQLGFSHCTVWRRKEKR